MGDLRKSAQRALQLMDFTTLADDDTPDRVQKLCKDAESPFGCTAAVCIYPQFVSTAKAALKAKLDWFDDSELEERDGLFWMSWEDFTSESFFDSVTVCHYFAPELYIKKTLTSAWARTNEEGELIGTYPSEQFPSKKKFPSLSM